jgi:regulatory protein
MEKLTLDEARAVALRYLGYAARSRAEMERRLERDGFSEAIIAQALEEIEARGWVDDRAYADAWIADRADRKSSGKRLLAQELQRKGIEKQTLQEALSQIAPEDEKERALTAALKKWQPSGDPALLAKEKRRLSDYLMRRGFSWDTIKQVFAELPSNGEEP